MNKKSTNTDIKALPEWLQQLWEENPALARKAEKDLGLLLGFSFENVKDMIKEEVDITLSDIKHELLGKSKVFISERDQFESEHCTIESITGDHIVISCKSTVGEKRVTKYKIPFSSINDISIRTRGNSLAKYVVD